MSVVTIRVEKQLLESIVRELNNHQYRLRHRAETKKMTVGALKSTHEKLQMIEQFKQVAKDQIK